MNCKHHHARALPENSKVPRRIPLDEREGSAHRAHGMPPNMAWIMGRGGQNLYKSSCTDAEGVDCDWMLAGAGTSRATLSDHIGPRVPGNMYKTEQEG